MHTNFDKMVESYFPVQILGLLFALFMVYLTFLYSKRKEFTLKEWGFWTVVWGIFSVLVLVPRILDPVIATIGIGRKMDLFIVAGFIFLIGISFYTYTLVRKNQKKIEKIVRNIAYQEK